MSDSTTKQTERLEALYQLSLSIGNSLDLQQMLSESGAAFFEQLAAFSLGVYQRVKVESSSTESVRFQLQEQYTKGRIKRNAAYSSAFAQAEALLAQGADTLTFVNQHEDTHQYGFDLPDYGVMLVLKKGDSLSEEEIGEKRPLFRKLAVAAAACLLEQQKSLAADMQLSRLAVAVEQSLDGTAVADLEGNIQFVNPAWAKMHGYQVEELIGLPLSIFHTEEQLQNEVEPFNQKIVETGGNQGEIGHKRKDGTTFPTWMSVVLLKNDDGIPIGLVASAQDITERKNSQIQAQSILNSITVPLVVSRITDGTVIYINELLADVIRLPLMELVGQQTPDFYYESTDRIAMLSLLQKRGSLSNHEIRLKRSDGEMFWGLVSIRPFDYQGESVLLSTILDITERKLVEEGLQDREDDLASLLDYSREAIGLVNTQTGLFENPNKAAEELYGLGYEELVATGPAQMSPEFQPDGRSSAEAAMEKIGEAMAGGQPIFDWTHINAAGEEILCEISLVGMHGKRSHLVRFSVVNIAERVQVNLKLRHQADLEKTGQSVSSYLLDLPPEKIDDGITQALQIIGEFADVDRAYMFVFADDGELMSNTHEWCAEGVEPYISDLQDLPAADFAFLTKYINKLEPFHVPRVADLPPEAAVEKEEFEKEGIQSIICMPLVLHDRAIGFIGFDAVHAEKTWEEGDVGLLRLVGNIFVSAMARKEAAQTLEAALAQTEVLYAVGREISDAENLDEMLAAMVKGARLPTINRSLLIIYERDAVGAEKIDLVMANWHDGRGMPPPDVGARFIWDKASTNVITRSLAPIFLGDGLDDERMDDATLEILEERNTRSVALLPLVAGTRHLGALVLEAETETQFTQADIERCLALSIQVTTAVDSYLLFERAQARAASLQTVASMSTVISATMDSNELLQLVSDRTKSDFDLYHAHIFLMSDNGKAMELRAGAGVAGKKLVNEKHRIPLDHHHSLVARSARTRKGVIANDVANTSDYMSNPYLPNTQAEMAIPILMGEHVLGVLDLQSDQVGYFYQEDLDIQTTLASQIAVALQNARQYDEAQEALLETKALLAITESANGTLDLDEVLEEVLVQVLDVTTFKSGLFSIVNPESESLELHAHHLPEAWVLGIRDGGLDGTLCDLVYRDESPILITDMTEDAPIDVSGMIADGYRSYQGVPLMAQGKVLGTLCLFGIDRLAEHEAAIEWLSAVGQQIGFAIQNAHLFERSEKTLKEMDVLTRRLTREGWDAYTDTQEQALSFAYDAGGVLEEGETAVIPTTPYEHPLLVYGEKIGNFSLFSHDDDDWDDETAEIITAVADQLTARIENLRLTDETQRALSSTEAQAQRLVAINQVAQAISQESDMEEMLAVAYHEIRSILSTNSFFVGFYDEKKQSIHIPLAFENDFVDRDIVVPSLPESNSYKVIHSGQPHLLILSEEEAAITSTQMETDNTFGDVSQQRNASQIFVPLRAGTTLLGLLSVQTYVLNAYNDSDVELVQGIANYVAVALENIRLLNETRTRAEQMAAINQVAQAVSQESDMDKMLEVVYKQIQAIMPVDSFFAGLYDAKLNTLTMPVTFEGENYQKEAFTITLTPQTSSYKVIQTGKYLLQHLTPEEASSQNKSGATIVGDITQHPSVSKLFVPLLAGTKPLGVLSVQSDQYNAYTASDIALLEGVANYVAVALENIRLFNETEERAEQLSTINRVAQTISEQLDLEQMLESVYKQINNILSVDSFFVSFYDEENNTVEYPLIFEGEHRSTELPRPVGETSNTRKVIDGGKPVLRHLTPEEARATYEESMRYGTMLGDHSQEVTKSSMYVPMQSGQNTLGILSIQSYKFNTYTQSDMNLVMGIAQYLAIAIENIRLFSETEKRAEQLATINRVAQTISEQLDLEQMLESVHTQLISTMSADSIVVGFYDKETDSMEYPLVMEGEHRSSIPSRPVVATTSTRKVIDSGQPILSHLTAEEAQIVLEESLSTGSLLGDHSSEMTKSHLYVPMQSGQNTLGVMSIHSYEFDAYTESDVDLLVGIAQYLAIAIENIRLFTDTQIRAAQLEKLSEIEGALSQAKSESDVIQALSLFSTEDQAITLHYVEESEDETPSYAYTVAHWENGECHPDDEYLMKPFLIEQHAGTSIGLRHPDQVTFISDIEQDDRMSAEAIEEAQRIGYGAVAIVPMRSAGRWQGFVSLKWPQAHQFTSDDLFLWQQLREPVGAVVAGRRAFMAQQGTLRETEALYEAGEKLNAAATYDDVLDVMREYTMAGTGAQNISLNYFSKPWEGDDIPDEVYVLARRTISTTEEDFKYTASSYQLRDFSSAQVLMRRDMPSLIEDVATDPRFDENARHLYMNVFGAVSTIFVPLVSGGQWFGYISSIYQQATEFPEEETRRLMVLAGQAAVSIQSIHLLDATIKRAEREQTLRQITERVRSSANVETVLQTAVQELSRALGRRAFIQLNSNTTGEAEYEQ